MEGGCKCKLSLPPNAAFQTIVGPLSRNTHLAKQLVCLEACKKLHKSGALDDHLRPSVEKPLEQDHIVRSKKANPGAVNNFLCINMLSLVINCMQILCSILRLLLLQTMFNVLYCTARVLDFYFKERKTLEHNENLICKIYPYNEFSEV